MLRLRVFESGGQVKVWLCDQEGAPLRELVNPIGDLPGPIDWDKTADSCRSIRGEGLEIDFAVGEG